MVLLVLYQCSNCAFDKSNDTDHTTNVSYKSNDTDHTTNVSYNTNFNDDIIYINNSFNY